MSNAVPVEELLRFEVDDGVVERVAFRDVKPMLEIVESDPAWPFMYETFASRIIAALGAPSLDNFKEPRAGNLIYVSHVGSTSVPGLPAKNIIDIDIVIADNNNESAYVPALEAQGFRFMFREKWYNHRFFTTSEPSFANLHVWGPRCPEAERHRIFKEWLTQNTEDRQLYAKVKKEASEASRLGGETVMQYNRRKEGVIKEILQRAFKGFGYIQ